MVISCAWCKNWVYDLDEDRLVSDDLKKDMIDSHSICPTCEETYKQMLAVAQKYKNVKRLNEKKIL